MNKVSMSLIIIINIKRVVNNYEKLSKIFKFFMEVKLIKQMKVN